MKDETLEEYKARIRARMRPSATIAQEMAYRGFQELQEANPRDKRGLQGRVWGLYQYARACHHDD